MRELGHIRRELMERASSLGSQKTVAPKILSSIKSLSIVGLMISRQSASKARTVAGTLLPAIAWPHGQLLELYEAANSLEHVPANRHQHRFSNPTTNKIIRVTVSAASRADSRQARDRLSSGDIAAKYCTDMSPRYTALSS